MLFFVSANVVLLLNDYATAALIFVQGTLVSAWLMMASPFVANRAK